MHAGDRIREERERLGFNQVEFAALAESTRKTLFNWESGTASPNATVLAAWAAAGLDVLYVVTGERSSAHPAHDAAEQVLLDSYRRCGAQARQHLIQTAALLAAGVPPEPAKRGSGSSGGQSVVGDNAIQIGSVSGKARIKNR